MNIEEQVLSREQMAHLQELGVDTSDASMCWVQFTNSEMGEYDLDIYDGTLYKTMKTPGNFVNDIVPTYTIGDLINKLPPEINDSVLMIFADAKTVSYTSWAAYSLDSDMVAFDYNGSTLMKALHGLLCWVAENYKELIK